MIPLKVRKYDPATDEVLIKSWWASHRREMLPVNLIPPLAVIVEDETGPAAFLVGFECFGVPLCMLDFPCTRPGMSPKEARFVFAQAVMAIKQLAGKCVEPPAVYSVFRAVPSATLFRAMTPLGFERETLDEMIPCVLVENVTAMNVTPMIAQGGVA